MKQWCPLYVFLYSYEPDFYHAACLEIDLDEFMTVGI